MKTKIIGTLATALVFLSCTPALAQDGDYIRGTGLFLEPGVTYQNTHSTVDYGSTVGNSSAGTRGFGAVLRGGVHVWERFFVAVDGRYAFLNFNDNATNIDVAARSWDVAPTIGMQMADWGARLYVGYALAGDLDPEAANGRDAKFSQANGWRAGLGLKARNVSVNIEWQRLHYGEASLSQPGGAATLTGVDYNGEGLVASITFPIEFN